MVHVYLSRRFSLSPLSLPNLLVRTLPSHRHGGDGTSFSLLVCTLREIENKRSIFKPSRPLKPAALKEHNSLQSSQSR